MKNLKISIITPSYNQGHFIEETILSVLNQGYDNLEYIIIDGGSTDNTVDIIKKYEDKLAYWVSERDNGQTHAINKGFEKATGDVIAWINSDDVYCKGSFQSVSDFFSTNTGVSALVGNELFMDGESNVYVRKYPNISRWLEKHCMMSILQSSTFLRRDVLKSVGFLKEDYHMMMDAEWFCRIYRKFPFHAIDKDLAVFRWYQGSKSSSDQNSKLYKMYIRESTMIIKSSHPYLSRLVDKYPNTSFKTHLWIGKMIRYMRRFVKGELKKLNDTNVPSFKEIVA